MRLLSVLLVVTVLSLTAVCSTENNGGPNEEGMRVYTDTHPPPHQPFISSYVNVFGLVSNKQEKQLGEGISCS